MKTSRDFVIDAINNKLPERLPATLYLDDSVKTRLEDKFGYRADEFDNDTVRVLWDVEHEIVDEQTFIDPFGTRWARSDGACHFVGPHSCGDNTAIMGDYVDIGLQVFHPLQPECMDIVHTKREYGKDLAFRGGVGTQGSAVHGTPQQARQAVFDTARVLSVGGGYLLEPCKPLPAETPVDTAMAFIEAMEKARHYQFN